MVTITDLFNDIINLQKSIGHKMSDYLLPGLSTDDLTAYEKQLNLKFTDEIFELYTITGGINPGNLSSGCYELLPLQILANFDYIVYRHSVLIQLTEANTSLFEDYYPEGINLFLLLYDIGAGQYWVDLNNKANHGHILRDFGAGETPGYTFNSIKSYLYFVKLCYEKQLVFLDEQQMLDWDIDKYFSFLDEYLANQPF